MDRRVAYGCTLKEALDVAYDMIEELPETEHPIGWFSLNHGTIWGELRLDGWRVYRAKTDDEFHMAETPVFGSYKKSTNSEKYRRSKNRSI